jgi:hypothetical protein
MRVRRLQWQVVVFGPSGVSVVGHGYVLAPDGGVLLT